MAQENLLINGQIVVFAEDVVAVAAVTKMRPREGFGDQSHEETRVNIRLVPRRSEWG